MTDDSTSPTNTERSIELSIEVPGTPEAVWEAIATGPGITSWYVPHRVEPRIGGTMSASFGPGMDVTGTVDEWSPPERVRFGPGADGPGLAFEWTIEANDDRSTCTVRLVNSGFGSGADWDDQYDGMTEGWRLFLANLHAHLTNFAGQQATASLPMAMWHGPAPDAWDRLTTELGLPQTPTVGEYVVADAGHGLQLGGNVLSTHPTHLFLLIDRPCPGTAFAAVEGTGDIVSVSIWSYLYGEPGTAAAATDTARWSDWLAARGVSDESEAGA
ncbi:MAG: SRPBCC domain-containing protein [Actinomycetota bacterium]